MAEGGATEGTKSAGKLLALDRRHGVGIALLRLRTALQAAEGQAELRIGTGASIRPYRPGWWPSEWGTEEGL